MGKNKKVLLVFGLILLLIVSGCARTVYVNREVIKEGMISSTECLGIVDEFIIEQENFCDKRITEYQNYIEELIVEENIYCDERVQTYRDYIKEEC